VTIVEYDLKHARKKKWWSTIRALAATSNKPHTYADESYMSGGFGRRAHRSDIGEIFSGPSFRDEALAKAGKN